MYILKLIGFLTILIAIWLVSNIVGSIFSQLASASGLGFLNRLFGFVAGGGKYFLIFALIVTALSNIALIKDNMKNYLQDSIIYPHLLTVGSYLINIDPNSLGITEVADKLVEHNSTTEDKNATIPANTKEQSHD